MTHNEYQTMQANYNRALESVELEVSKMSLTDIFWELDNLKSMGRLDDVIYKLVRDAWRKDNIPNKIDSLLIELYRGDNRVDFVLELGLEKKVRELFIEKKLDEVLA